MRLWTVFFLAALFCATGSVRSEDQLEFDRGRNTAIKPGDDFNAFANGAFLDNLVIPPDRAEYGVGTMLTEAAERHVREILESPPPGVTADALKAAALYRAFMDQERLDALGATPLSADLAAIAQAQTRDEVAGLMGTGVENFQPMLFSLTIETDAKSPDRYAVVVAQSGLGLPDRDYYLQPLFATQLAKYGAYIAQMLTLAGWPDADAQASAVLLYETRIAAASWSRLEQRDPNKVYSPTLPAALSRAAPGFNWQAWLNAAGLGDVHRLVVSESSALPRLAGIFGETSLVTLRAWAAFHLVDNAAPYLAKPFADAHFDFHDRLLSGQLQPLPRWQRAVALVNDAMGEAVGRVYVAQYFPGPAKALITALTTELREAFAARIQRLDWMSAETKAKAERKLSQLSVKVGYPDNWRDYSKLEMGADDLYGDIGRIKAFEWNRERTRLDQPVDRTEWGMTPQTVNAYYNPTANEIVFPAAFLQAPFFDAGYDAAANYGGIGAAIGHEMTHGFDDEGRYFDGNGALVNWWTPEDALQFTKRAAALAGQYDQYEPYDGVHVNGMLTNGENIADLGGVVVALDAYHRSLRGQPAPVIDGLSGDQRFFLAYARSWREKRREAATRERLVSNPHAPEQYRVNGVVRNVDAWYNAFSIEPGDRLYLDPTARVHIW